ncbi:ABC transporter inner membrane protein [Bordetella pertussis]|nr:ABC transporter inner membrane protein [Bordetella pertussis]
MIDPFLVVANAMPKIAFVYAGFRGVDPNKMKLAYTFGASRWQVLTKVILPGSVPTLIAAVKMNIGLALVGVIVGEFQSADLGLGFLIMNGSQIFKLNIVMTAITLLALISSVMYLVIYRLEAAVARRYA